MLKNTLYIFCLCFIFSCKSDDDVENLSVSEYPSTIGSKWEYRLQVKTTPNDEEILNDETTRFFQKLNDNAYYYTSKEIIAKELIDGVETVVFEELSKNENSDEEVSYIFNYYQENDSYLYLANDGSKSVFYKFPLRVGDTWFQIKKDDAYLKKTVVGTEYVTVPAGTFNCFKIETELVIGHDIVNGYEYISDIGVVKYEHTHFIFFTDEDGQLLTKDEVKVYRTEELTDYIIK